MKIVKHISPLFFFLLLHSFTARAQTKIIDSLKQVLQSQKEDTSKVNTLNSLSRATRQNGDTVNAKQYAENALSLAEKINFSKGQGNAYVNFSGLLILQNKYPEAIKQNFIALKLFEESGEKQQVARCYQRIAEIYYQQLYNYPEALKNFYMSLKLYEELRDKEAINKVYGLIGNIYHATENYPELFKTSFTRLKLNEELGNKSGTAEMLQNIGGAYMAQKNDPEALKYFLASLRVRKEIGDSSGIGQAYNSIGLVYSRQDKNAEALQMHYAALKIFQSPTMPAWGIPLSYDCIANVYTKQGDSAFAAGNKIIAAKKFFEAEKTVLAALQIWEKNKTAAAFAQEYNILGFINIKLKNFQQAKDYFVKARQLSLLSNNKNDLIESYLGLSQLDSIQGKYKQAYEHYKMHVLYRDSLYNKENTKKSLQVKLQYESDKQNAIIMADQARKDAEQRRAKTVQYFVMGSLIVLVLIVLLIAYIQWRNNQHKKKANSLLQNQKEKAESALIELQSAQTQLIQSEKMASLGELTAGIAHEIQNPLNFVNNFSDVNGELLAELNEEIKKGNYKEVETIAQDLIDNEKKINHHGKRADAIVKGMLQHSRSSSGIKEPTNINVLADEYLRLSYHGLRAKDKLFNATMKTDFDGSMGNINIIPQDIGRVILNLINNAFYAVTERKNQVADGYEPTVTITSKKINNKIELRVIDNGNGISQKVLDKIFQPFFTTKPTGQGTGLGLSLSYDIVKAHGGEIKVETKEGQGSEFIIHLPIN